jgi:hypothetical protein
VSLSPSLFGFSSLLVLDFGGFADGTTSETEAMLT